MTASGAAIWLYGSEARGDSLPNSDVDLLVIGTSGVPPRIAGRFAGRRLSVSNYGWHEVNTMASYGSLFLHHIKSEGIVLDECSHVAGRLRQLLEKLPPYAFARKDVCAFRQSLADIAAELPQPAHPYFECSNLAALIRRIGILGSYVVGRPRFDRLGPLKQIVSLWGLPNEIGEEFVALYEYRVAADQHLIPSDESKFPELGEWIGRADMMLNRLEEQIDGRQSTLHQTN